MKRIALAVLIALIVPAASSAAGGKDIVFKTGWKDRDLVIDGNSGDWQGALGFLSEPPVMLGFLNDDDAVYVCLSTNLPAIREGMLRRGVTVWIDPKGGKRKTLGIRMAPADGTDGRPEGGPPKGETERAAGLPAPPEGAAPPEFGASAFRLMVRLPGREDWTPVEGGAGGLEAAIEESGGLAVLEMTVPLKVGPEAPFAVGATPGAAISMSFETPRPERPAGRPDGPVGDRSGRRGGMRGGVNGPPGDEFGGPPGGGFGQNMEDPFKNTEGLKLRVEMKLASR